MMMTILNPSTCIVLYVLCLNVGEFIKSDDDYLKSLLKCRALCFKPKLEVELIENDDSYIKSLL